MSAHIHTGGAADVSADYCEAGVHSFVSLRVDYGSITIRRDGLTVRIGGPISVTVSPANARALAEQILAALPAQEARAA